MRNPGYESGIGIAFESEYEKRSIVLTTSFDRAKRQFARAGNDAKLTRHWPL